MKCVLLFLTLIAPGMVLAQSPGAKPTPKPTLEKGVESFAVSVPDEGSPFFSERLAAKYALTQPGQEQLKRDAVAVYPRVKNSPDTASGMVRSFFTDMFASVKLGSLRSEETTEKLLLDPADFSVQDLRGLDATYTIRNNTSRVIRLDYTTTQRMEILTKDSTGNLLERLSDDRAFQPKEGIVIINPKERIEYNAKVATRDMKANETYSVQAEVTGYPDYTVTKTVTPAP
ncbi:MAG: BsuPI-related putative proteinase inhibitor [Verrucomicrobiota bacterium]